jgi:hypothetical protein
VRRVRRVPCARPCTRHDATEHKHDAPSWRTHKCACLAIKNVKHGGGLARFYRGRLSRAGGDGLDLAAAAILAEIKERSARSDRFAGRIAWSSARSHVPPSAEHIPKAPAYRTGTKQDRRCAADLRRLALVFRVLAQ